MRVMVQYMENDPLALFVSKPLLIIVITAICVRNGWFSSVRPLDGFHNMTLTTWIPWQHTGLRIGLDTLWWYSNI